MKHFLSAFILFFMSGLSTASACFVFTADVKATLRGAKVENNLCVVLATIQEVAPAANCSFNIKPKQTVWIKVPYELLVDGCPQTRGHVLEGTIATIGDGFWLDNGTVSKAK